MIDKPKGFIYINDYAVPYPDKDSGLQTQSTVVDSARTLDGVMRGERVGRDLSKIELSWKVLKPEEWSRILKILNNFKVTVRYWGMMENTWVTRLMYCGDRSAIPYMINSSTGKPKYWVSCSVNLIDIGG